MADSARTARTARRRGSRPILLDLYLIRGVAAPFLVITLAVCAAMMLERALRLVHELAGRGADLSYFLPMLGELVPYYLDLALPAAFMVALILLPSLFWLVALKRTTTYLGPEEWLMQNVVVPFHDWMEANLPLVDGLITAVSALGSGWFVGLGFAFCGLFALAKGRRDLALLLALGTLAFPIEWALKYFVALCGT